MRPHPTISFVIGNIIFFPYFIPFLAHEVKFIGVGHQQPWYWLCWTKIIRSPHVKDWNLQTYSEYILKLMLCQIYHSCLILLVIAHDGWHYIASFTKGCLSSEVFPLSQRKRFSWNCGNHIPTNDYQHLSTGVKVLIWRYGSFINSSCARIWTSIKIKIQIHHQICMKNII